MQIIDLADNTRVPLFAELDAAANPALGDRQALLIHPMARLASSGHYAVALRRPARRQGQRRSTPAGFRALRDQGALSGR